ncbi:unnamed protein product [Strongylus vulgaris]|uniref:G-protein coupled receptors family 1 profile domain-containing protein n=1 Tax=Strongylus vulgaris TaxID=40348 RepID=A0A3P7J9Q9_STRVU|nr:unnamed protein product [Strongylus vulgaris]
MDFFLVTDIVVLVLQVLAITLNVITLFALYRIKKESISTRLVMYLTVTDFIHALLVSFYTLYLLVKWNPVRINMDPYIVMISAMPLTFQLKVNLILTIAIALDRVLALYVPVQYRMISSLKFVAVALVLATVFGICDLIIEFLLSPIVPKIDCAAVGCFVSPQFRSYWGTSNMILGLCIIVLTAFVLVKLHHMRVRARRSRTTNTSESSKLAQANRSSTSFLLSSLVCLTVPSVIVGGAELFGFSLFEYIGPFYLVGLLCASEFCN